jgi:catechol 2,3-dioxygenase-like lactoylglutathione lyase family enzyme
MLPGGLPPAENNGPADDRMWRRDIREEKVMKIFRKVAPLALLPMMIAARPSVAPVEQHAAAGFELGAVTILVKNEDEAAAWYKRNLGLEVVMDTHASDGERFIAMKPGRGTSPLIVLHRPHTTAIAVDRTLPETRIGQETYWVWRTDDFDADYKRLHENHVKFVSPIRNQFYGREAVFEDLYGNLFILQQFNGRSKPAS